MSSEKYGWPIHFLKWSTKLLEFVKMEKFDPLEASLVVRLDQAHVVAKNGILIILYCSRFGIICPFYCIFARFRQF